MSEFTPVKHGRSLAKKLGEGTFGTVFLAYDDVEKEYVAIKKIKLKKFDEGVPKDVIREIEALKWLRGNPNIIELKAVFLDEDCIVLVLELLEFDLFDYIKFWKTNEGDEEKRMKEIQRIMYMLISAVHQCHMNNIMHRDIKPSNIMFDKSGKLKLIDFGLARVSVPDESLPERVMSLEIGTRWYKAPEVLLGAKDYDKSIDIWAIGCIFGELLGNKTLFKGCNDIEQIVMVIKTIGTPNDTTWPNFKNLPDFPKLIFPKSEGTSMKDIFPKYEGVITDFLQDLLTLNPENRLLTSEALKNKYFTDDPPREEDCYIDLPSMDGEGEDSFEA
ncbi:unnamed protein product [Moneuplotes crassus]|uniref:Cyclin-dependent kinase 2 homolog n=1 Tax=Euplotes crassus TaxID=5936 RepID=A0AAD1URC6_EUPCR|nr:unnamed protein product [Moneuplotes crassus]